MNREFDESQTLEDPPVTYAVETEFFRSLHEIPREKWGRLAEVFIWEWIRQPGAASFLRRLANVPNLKRRSKADLKAFMQKNWGWLRKLSSLEIIEVLRKEGFEVYGPDWLEKWCREWGLKFKRQNKRPEKS